MNLPAREVSVTTTRHRISKEAVTMSKKTDSIRPNVQRIADRPTAQVLVVGGGINGIATFRDLALQGVDVVLV